MLCHQPRPMGSLWSASFRIGETCGGRYSYKEVHRGTSGDVFDPLGIASPFMVRAEIPIQDLWTMGLGVRYLFV